MLHRRSFLTHRSSEFADPVCCVCTLITCSNDAGLNTYLLIHSKLTVHIGVMAYTDNVYNISINDMYTIPSNPTLAWSHIHIGTAVNPPISPCRPSSLTPARRQCGYHTLVPRRRPLFPRLGSMVGLSATNRGVLIPVRTLRTIGV
jgi:hypothetical protein